MDWLLAETLNFFKIPTVLYLHSQGFRDLRDRNPLFRTAARRLFSNASRVVCLSPRLYDDVSSLVEKEKVTFVANALLSEPNFPDQGKAEFAAQQRRVLFLSNLLPEKGIDTFVDLAIKYCHDSLDTVFDIVGPATYEFQIEKYRERVRSAGYERNIFFHGAQAGEQKWNILNSSSLLVFPSMLNEAQPLTIVEAFACGVPVIAYANGGIPDMIDSGTNGVLVEPGDSAGLLQAVKGALASTEWRLSAGRAASHSYELNYSRSRFRDAWGELLGQIRVERR
ncbi:glycosyltransferase family 4 protein [Arthrobacter sp. JZ12]|uniref:glycosyltransferase family 4 protein n=1 Tax=Arthrobacter sp. JZ12 TaxID=2654190 RepID=UPI002B496D02|nr:glycosyltransferase family 4 protein [Arthrobacter sp. JZ12]